MKKKCSKCQKIKPYTEFYKYKDNRTKDGLYSACKKCHYLSRRDYYGLYREKNKEKLTEYHRDWEKNNRRKLSLYTQKWRDDNRESFRLYQRKWKKNNREKANKYQRNWMKDPKNRIDNSMKCLIWQSLNGKKAGRKWQELVGYTIADLLIHLKNKFDNKMTFDNYGSYWEIDHIRPRSLFKYEKTDDIEFKKCWGLENLQPLEVKENRRKGNNF